MDSSAAYSVWTENSRDILGGGNSKNGHTLLRPHSTPATLVWLEENYETAEGVCIPRNTLYMHYVDFCAKNYMQPVNAASFGKIIRQQFPTLTTRRLGTRGQSRYHYYGIAIRENSAYFQVSFSKKGAIGCEPRRDANKQTPLYSTRTRAGTVLPEFPSVKDLHLPPSVDIEKMSTFLMMYRTHCQRLLDTIIRGSFDEVQSFLLHFWQGIPSHLLPILESNALVNLVGVCDCILYRTISNALLPSMLHTVPESLTKVVRKFAEELDCWLKSSISHLPDNLKIVKLEMANRFSHTLRRQMSLNHLAQASRMVVHNSDITSQMLHDWRQLDLDAICRETLFSTEHSATTCQLILKLGKEFESLLEEEAPIESYTEWLELLVNKCAVHASGRRKGGGRRLARQFLLLWSAFGTRVIRDMTLHSAASFGSFHLLRLMFDDYVLFLVETIHTEDQMKDFMRNLMIDVAPQISSFSEYQSLSSGIEMDNIEQFNLHQSQNYAQCSSTSPSTHYEEIPTDDQHSEWMPGECYQSSYPSNNICENRRTWNPSIRHENKAYNYQQTAQYLIVSQDQSSIQHQYHGAYFHPYHHYQRHPIQPCHGVSN
ncbi:transcription factor RFX4 isoform X2 [Parasteatoda tepidariorum]|uniref:transcription factor RFX4 isoform X2 n=1 Tax=Parasteatoda tepidariorum TaxID=114398 RepID=UPI001C72924B|nr:transcription factor RFX4 isoform X2 [Parasteatoda tepidariorum]